MSSIHLSEKVSNRFPPTQRPDKRRVTNNFICCVHPVLIDVKFYINMIEFKRKVEIGNVEQTDTFLLERGTDQQSGSYMYIYIYICLCWRLCVCACVLARCCIHNTTDTEQRSSNTHSPQRVYGGVMNVYIYKCASI